ncbi:MAG: hypothetical protein ACK53Y_01360 [bacterium]
MQRGKSSRRGGSPEKQGFSTLMRHPNPTSVTMTATQTISPLKPVGRGERRHRWSRPLILNPGE